MNKQGLFRKLLLGLVALTMLGSLLFASTLYLLVDRFETKLLDQTTANELAVWVELLRTGHTEGVGILPGRRFYLLGSGNDAGIPAVLRDLGDGTFHDIQMMGQQYHVAVRAVPEGKAVLALNIEEIESAEGDTQLMLAIGVLLLLLSFLLIAFFARRLVSPVERLAQEVSNLDPESAYKPLATTYQDYEVGLIAQAVDRFRLRLAEYVQRERLFTSAVSHELRTPLSVIATSTELLDALPAQTPTPTTSAVLQRIHRSSHQMNDIMSSLLFLAREGRGSWSAPEQRKCDLSALLEEIIADHRQLLDGMPVELTGTFAANVLLAADESHLRMIINNLLRNAIQHTPQGRVDVSLSARQLSIRDTGSGIAPEHLDRLFERDFSDFKHRGIGLGLYLSKQLCERYDMTLQIDSTQGAGTTASIFFAADAPV